MDQEEYLKYKESIENKKEELQKEFQRKQTFFNERIGDFRKQLQENMDLQIKERKNAYERRETSLREGYRKRLDDLNETLKTIREEYLNRKQEKRTLLQQDKEHYSTIREDCLADIEKMKNAVSRAEKSIGEIEEGYARKLEELESRYDSAIRMMDEEYSSLNKEKKNG